MVSDLYCAITQPTTLERLAQYLAAPELFPYRKAMAYHLNRDACRLCGLLLKSTFLSSLARLLKVGRQIEEVKKLAKHVLITYVQLPKLRETLIGGAFAPSEEPRRPVMSRAELADHSALTVMETNDGELVGYIDLANPEESRGVIELELVGDDKRLSDTLEITRSAGGAISREHSFGNCKRLAQEVGPDCIAIVGPAIEIP